MTGTVVVKLLVTVAVTVVLLTTVVGTVEVSVRVVVFVTVVGTVTVVELVMVVVSVTVVVMKYGLPHTSNMRSLLLVAQLEPLLLLDSRLPSG